MVQPCGWPVPGAALGHGVLDAGHFM